MKDKTMLHARIKETGESLFAVNIEVSGHRLKGDEPVDAHGGNLGPAPYDLLTAALGECTAMSVRWYAKKHDWPLDTVEVNMTHEKIDGGDVFTKEIIVHGDTLTEEQRKKLVEVAAKCPVQRTLESEIVIHTK
jgi:putative redox protein